ncbi:MAG: AbrB/MazE/SpoVT family DNA-binding domain-containing protein [Prochloraceae cyanobacterium]
MEIVTIEEGGRISLSAKVREQLNLKSNEQLSLELKGDRLILKPLHKEPEFDYENGILVIKSPLTIDLDKIIEEEREPQIEELKSW